MKVSHTLAMAGAALVFLLVLSWVMSVVAEPQREDQCPPAGISGMRLYTDNLTGCQYLSNG
jgi:hypothetical protein